MSAVGTIGNHNRSLKCACVNCLATNCGVCKNCRGKKQFGGDNRNHQRCERRICLTLHPHAPVYGLAVRDHAFSSTSYATTTTSSASAAVSRGGSLGLVAVAAAPEGARYSKRAREQSKSSINNGKMLHGSTNVTAVVPNKRPKRADDQSTNHRDLEAKTSSRRRRSHSSSMYVEPSRAFTKGTIDYADDSLEDKKPAARVTASNGSAKHPPPIPGVATAAMIDIGEPFSLTSYLAESIQNQDDSGKRIASHEQQQQQQQPTNGTLYGLPIPPETAADVCSGCLGARDDELDDHPVLLCDGVNCGREYHLVCCLPPLMKVPDVETWLCRDCCPDGSTAQLREYFISTDRAKADWSDENNGGSVGTTTTAAAAAAASVSTHQPEDYLRYLLQKDCAELDGGSSSPTTTTHNRIPESELSRGAMIHALALCVPNDLARTRGGSEKREALATTAYIGRPIRIFDTVGNMYHTGRIVAHRNNSSSSNSSNSSTQQCDDTIETTEFLVRFTAGKDYRKSSYQHWIVLEEHALAVGSSIVWAQIPAGHWKPAILWLRTSRELVPLQHLLKESEGEIMFQTADSTYWGSPSKKKHKVSALARSFGDDIFAIVNVRDQAVDLKDAASTTSYLKEAENMIQYQMAKAELAEQEKVRQWSRLEQVDPMGPKVLSSVDYYTLPALIPTPMVASASTAPSSLPSSSTLLCPNVALGLDRHKILHLLEQRGIVVQPSKDVAASLSCEIIPVNATTLQAERLSRRAEASS